MDFIERKAKMNNKRGGVGAKILLVLILMIASAVGGAYGYRVLDGKMAVNEANKALKNIEVGDYDTEEATQIQGYLDDVNKDLATAKPRKEVYEIMDEFKEDISKIQTKTQKELEAARKEAENARNANQNNNTNNYNNSNNTNDSNNSNNYDNSGNNGNSTDTNNGYDNSNNAGTQDNSGNSGYKSNNLSNAEDGTEDSGSGNGILSNLFGNND